MVAAGNTECVCSLCVCSLYASCYAPSHTKHATEGEVQDSGRARGDRLKFWRALPRFSLPVC